MAGKYQVGESWYITWVDDKKQQRRSVGKVTEAEAEAKRLAKEYELEVQAAAGPPFADWAAEYGVWHAREYPDSYYRVEQIIRCHLVPFFGTTHLLAIRRKAIEAYKEMRLEKVAAGTVVKEIRTLQAIMNAAVSWEKIPHNPIASVKAPRDLTSRPPRWFSREELARLYSVELDVPKCTTKQDADLHRRFRWSWQLMANTGIRRGEALHLQWRDVGAEEIGIRSEADERTKSGKWRSIPISTGANEALSNLREQRTHVIPQLNPTSITRAFARTLRRATLDGNLHSLRHTYCAHLVQRGIPLRTVQLLAGHASHTTTEKYAHLAPSHLRVAISTLDL